MGEIQASGMLENKVALDVSQESDSIQALIEHIARELVTEPNAVHVASTGTENSKVYELMVAERDCGRVIGKTGHTITAIRAILSCIAARENISILLNVEDRRRRKAA